MKSRVLKSIAVAALSLGALTSCADKFRAELDEIQGLIDQASERLDEVEAAVNADVQALVALVTALEQKDYITSVNPVYEDGEIVGYRITFFKGGEITIRNGADGQDGIDGADGKDGQDGADGKDGQDGQDGTDGKDGQNGKDGKDGHTPVLGVRQDSDGKWYWTIDGEWLLDSSGNKVSLTPVDGEDGSTGSDGNPGSDGITPLMKIENGKWYVSTDNGATWVYYGIACGGDGNDGPDGTVAEGVFASVNLTGDSAVFVLKNGTVIVIPMQKPIFLTMEAEGDISIAAGGSVSIAYSVSGGTEQALVECAAQGQWKAVVTPISPTTGTVTVQAPDPFSQGKVLVFAYAPDGRMSVCTLTFTELLN